jgi:DNA repair protein RadC
MRINQYTTQLDNNKFPYLVKKCDINYLEKIDTPHKVAGFCNNIFSASQLAEECVFLICASSKNKVNGVFEVSIGSINTSIIPIREMFQKALLCGAANIFIAHNHPSGDPTPSTEDIRATQRIKEASEIIGINFNDHIIIGDHGQYISMREQRYI